MPDLAEEITSSTTGNLHNEIADLPAGDRIQGQIIQGTGNDATVSGWRSLRRARTNIGRAAEQEQGETEYETELVDILDLVGTNVLVTGGTGN
jgi:hypothetical protein